MNIRIGTIAAALLALSAPALTQAQESTASTLSRLIECKLSAEEVSSFVERINAEQVQDILGQLVQENAGDAPLHQPLIAEFPILVAIRAKPAA